MFEKIVFISDQGATVKLKNSENITMNLMNLHLVFEDETKKVLGEVNDVNGDTLNASFLGEIVGDRFLGGTIRKPRLDAKIRVINEAEIQLITGKDERGYMKLGDTPFYDGSSVFLDVNNFFSSHFAIFGNSGSGKSCGISRLFQNMFRDSRLNPCNANIIMLDSSGEYYNAFSNLNSINPSYHYRFISTNENTPGSEKLRIPIYLLNVDDLALLLQVTTHSQLPIVERMRKLALVFSQKDMDANNYKNHLIAKAIMTILYTNETAPNKRNEVFSILASCSTPQFNLEAVVQGIGYTRKFRECFLIDNSGNFSESVLLTEYVSSFIDDELDAYEPEDGAFYTLDTLEKALNFTLISEGWLRNKNTYGDAVTLKVRLHSLIVSTNAEFFDVQEYMTVDQYLKTLVNKDNRKCQFVNINLDDVDDSFAKVITKIFSRLIFDYSKSLMQRASNPFHIIVEEAHRYIQNDTDRFLLGYNIFERIAKEGRKYGVILGIITQRPVELSDTVISQCSNFLIFKMNHPVDVEYIRKMVPNISDEIVEKQKTLQAGTCLGFGSAFRIPMIVRMEMPDPAPWSGNCDVVSFWGGGSATASMSAPSNNVSAIPEISVPTTPSLPSVPTAVSSTGSGPTQELVKLNSVPQTAPGAGEFGLAQNNNVNSASVNTSLPTTDSGVSLITLSGDSGSNGTLELPKTPPVAPAPPQPSAVPIVQGIEPKMSDNSNDSGDSDIAPEKPLVSFLGGTSSNQASAPVNTSSNIAPFVKESSPTLVSFSEPVANNSGINNVSDVSTSNNVPTVPNNLVTFSSESNSSNVTAAPVVDTSSFINTGSGVDEEILDVPDANTSGIRNIVNTSSAPPLVNLNTPNVTNANNFNEGSNTKDTFGKPDFNNLNNNLVPANMSAANPNNGFVANIPSNMNFGGNDNDGGNSQVEFTSGDALVNFIENMN